MKKLILVIRNFLVANLFFLLPVIAVLCGSVADKLEITVKVPESTKVQLSFGDATYVANCGKEDNARTASFAFPDGLPSGLFSIDFSIPKEKVSVEKIEWVTHFFLKRDYLGASDGQPKWSGPHINHSAKWAKRLVFVECLLFVVALLALKIKPCSLKIRIGLSLLLAFHFSVFFALVVPIGTWLGNRDIFPFSSGEMIGAVLPVFALVLMIAFVSIFVLSCVFDRWSMMLVFAVLLYEYLLTGVLSSKIPPLNGDFGLQWEAVSAIPDFLALGCIFCGLFLAYNWIKSWLPLLSIGLMVMNVAALVDVGIKATPDRHETKFVHMSDEEIISNLTWSAKTNVIVLVMDSVRMDTAARIVQNDRALAQKFSGFIAFDNNLGMGPTSKYGVPGILTGRFYTPETDTMDFMDTQRQDGNYVSFYERRGAAVYFRTDSAWLRYTNRCSPKQDMIVPEEVESKSLFMRRVKTIPEVNLFTVVRFRIVPTFWKMNSYKDSMEGALTPTSYSSERVLYPILAGKKVSEKDSIALYHFHTEGVHLPHNIDRQGKTVFSSRSPRIAEEEATGYVLDQFGALMDMFREKNIYNHSFIIALADHGNDSDHVAGDDGRKYPMLWVKPFGSQGGMIHCDMPTSHERVHDLVIDAYDHIRTKHEIVQMLKCQNRKFVMVDERGHLVKNQL